MFISLFLLIFGDDGPDAKVTQFSQLRPRRFSQTISRLERESILKSQKLTSATQLEHQVPWEQLIKSKDVLVISLSWYFIYIYCK